MGRFVILIPVLLLGFTSGEDRNPRWFNRDSITVTRVLKERVVVTEVTPSSCVVVQTSLPPCRHLRQLPIAPSAPTRIFATAAPVSTSMDEPWRPLMRANDPVSAPPQATPPLRSPPPKQTSTWSWDFFNMAAPREITVTKTIQELFTTKYMDPNTVVTFSVKGCRPSRLPFDLPECRPPQKMVEPALPEANVIVMAPVQFVPGMDHITPAKAQQAAPSAPAEPADAPTLPQQEEKS